MKVYILSNHGIPTNHNFYDAYTGFHEMGFETILFEKKDGLSTASKEDVVVGYINTIRYQLKRFNIPIIDIDYPPQLNKYLGRKIWKSTINEVNSNISLWPVFVKPIEDKRFTGRLIKSTRDLIGCGEYGYNAEVYCSEPINLLAEWRCYVRYNKIIDIKRYRGTYKNIPNYALIEQAVSEYTTAPSGYSIDFGLTEDNRTLLIEVNDGYALGNYGINSIDYAKLLSARWHELTNTIDECNF